MYNHHAACWRRRDGPPRSYRPESIARRRHGRPSLQGRHMTFRCPSMPPELQIGPRARAQMSFAVRHLLGTLAVGGAEDSSHHRSASFWRDLDDGSSVPKGAEGSSPSALPRLCATATASSYRRCNTGEEGGLLLLEYTSRGRSWQRLLEPRLANFLYWSVDRVEFSVCESPSVHCACRRVGHRRAS